MPGRAAHTALVGPVLDKNNAAVPYPKFRAAHLAGPGRTDPDKGRNVSRTGENTWSFGETELEELQAGISVTAVTIFTAGITDS